MKSFKDNKPLILIKESLTNIMKIIKMTLTFFEGRGQISLEFSLAVSMPTHLLRNKHEGKSRKLAIISAAYLHTWTIVSS